MYVIFLSSDRELSNSISLPTFILVRFGSFCMSSKYKSHSMPKSVRFVRIVM